MSATLKYQFLIPDLLLLPSKWCNLHLLIGRTITVKDIFQISLIFFYSQISTPALKSYEFYKYLKVHWGSEGKQLLSFFVCSFLQSNSRTAFPLLGRSFSFQLKELIWVVVQILSKKVSIAGFPTQQTPISQSLRHCNASSLPAASRHKQSYRKQG